MTIEKEIETLEGFEAWLSRKKSTQFVGYARTACLCPLAEYLLDFCQLKVEVCSDGLAIGDGRREHSELTWEFARLIDEGRTCMEPITAAQAMQALKSAQKAIKGGNP